MIGIMLPAWNAEKWIAESIQSIIDQTYTEWILQIVDDGSDDKTIKICQQYLKSEPRLRIHGHHHQGCPQTRNKCLDLLLQHPEITHIAWQDADDISDTNRLQYQMDYLKNNPEIDLVRSTYDWINENGDATKNMSPRPANATMLAKRKWFENYKIPEEKWHGSDGSWMQMVAKAGCKMGMINQILYHQRRHLLQISKRKRGK